MTIAILQGDSNHGDGIERVCREGGFPTRRYRRNRELFRDARASGIDLCILHWSGSFSRGEKAIEHLRQMHPSILIFVIFDQPDRELELLALHEGADDCIARPWDDRVLVARLQALIRRRNIGQRPPRPTSH